MTKFLLQVTLLGIISIACQPNQTEIAELKDIIQQLKTDRNNEFLATLKPTHEDLRLLFRKGASVNMVIAYADQRWADVSKIPKNSMKPLTENATLQILTVSKTELENGITNGLPTEYLLLVDHLQDDVILFAMQYLNEDGSEQKMRSAFFKASGNWLIIPLAYKAFE